MTSDPNTADDLPESHKRVAIKWLMWEHGMTTDEAASVFIGPLHERSLIGRFKQEATDVATFIVEECHGR